MSNSNQKEAYQLEATVNLHFPVETGGKEIKAITLRSPKVSDRINSTMQVAKIKDPAEREWAEERQLLINLSGIQPATLEDLQWVDYVQLQEALTAFQYPQPAN